MRKIWILLATVAVFVGIILVVKSTGIGTDALWDISRQGQWLLPLILVSAVLDSINPCAFSILLVTIAFLLSIGQVRQRILRIGMAYIAGIFFAYFAIGLGILQVLHLFDTPHFMGTVGAWLLIALGAINIINEYVPSFPIKPSIPHAAHRRIAALMNIASIPAAVGLGALVGLCEFPCTGGPYMSAVGLLHDQATYLTGAGYLILYNIVFVLPLVIVLGLASSTTVLGRLQEFKRRNLRATRLYSGSAMIALGALILVL